MASTVQPRIQRVAEVGVGLALAAILSQVVLYKMPQGGSVSLGSMVPLWILARRHGVATGMLAGAIHGLIQAGTGTVVHPVQGLLDYVLAYAVLGLAGWRLVPWPMAVGLAFGGRLTAHLLATPFFLASSGVGAVSLIDAMAEILEIGLAYNVPILLLETLVAVILWRGLLEARPELDRNLLREPSSWTDTDKMSTI